MNASPAPAAGNTPHQAASLRVGRFRWTICALLFFATTINYMDRQILGILAPVLEREIGWTEQQYANIVTAFQAAYALGLVAFGRLVDRFGTRHGYALSVTLWSVAAAAHGLTRTVFGFGLARFGLGLAEAGNFPAAVKTVAEWFPRRERALASGIFNSGANVAAMITPLVVPWLTLKFGWQSAFVAIGAIGFLWLVFWYWLYAPPERSSRVGAAELAHILSDPPEPEPPRVSWKSLLSYRQTWTYIVGIALSSPIWWFYLYWLPKFLHQRHGLDIVRLGPPLFVVYTMTCVGSVGGGWLSSALLRRGWSINAARKTALLVCACSVVPIVFAAQVSNLWVCTLLIGLAASAHQGWSANLFALVGDLFPKSAVASVVGLGGMFGSLVAMVFSQTAGHILAATGSYWSLFAIAAGAYLTALLIMHTILPRFTRIEHASA